MSSLSSTTVGPVISRICEDLSTPRSLAVYLMAKYGEWDQLATLKLDPSQYCDPDRFWRDAMATEFLRKCEDLPTTFDRSLVAEQSFLDCEMQNFRTNLRLLPYLSPGQPETDEGVSVYLRRVRKIATSILGEVPRYVGGRHGPGATYGDKGSMSIVPDKMSSEPTITPGAWPFYFQWMGTKWCTAVSSLGQVSRFIPGNRFAVVPKDCTKNRSIAVEPSINVFYQLGYGRVIRQRLRKASIDLDVGQEIHRRVACDASSKGHLATIDLSNASDTVSSNLVKLVLPPAWFDILDDLRSKKTLFRGKWYLLEKFSSMGNGFTFELETLIFLCLILALDPTGQKLVPGESVYVFGDDIIVPSDYSNAVTTMLKFFGLSANTRKTFVDGPFRESCGGDYFDGVSVRAHYLKSFPIEPQHFMALANGLRRACASDPKRWKVLQRSWFLVLDQVPSLIRDCRGPESLGDLVIHDDESRWRPRIHHSIRYFRCYKPAVYRKVNLFGYHDEVLLATSLLGIPVGPTRRVPNGPEVQKNGFGYILPRDSVQGYKIGWVACS